MSVTEQPPEPWVPIEIQEVMERISSALQELERLALDAYAISIFGNRIATNVAAVRWVKDGTLQEQDTIMEVLLSWQDPESLELRTLTSAAVNLTNRGKE